MVWELIILFPFGGWMLWRGISGLRTKSYEDGISLIEAAVLKATGEEPLPITPYDRAFGKLTCWMMIIFGVFFAGVGLIGTGLIYD